MSRMSLLHTAASLKMAVILFLATQTAWPVAAQEVLPKPSVTVSLPGAVHATLLMPDGSMVFGGEFDRANGAPRAGLARMLPNGTLDEAFTPSFEGVVTSLALAGNGSILAGGGLFTYPNERTYILRRILPDGSSDTEWVTPTFDRPVHRIAVDEAGFVFVSGEFSSVGETPRRRLAKMALDGALVDAWNPDPVGSVHALAVANGVLYVGGAFTSIGGGSVGNLAGLDLESGQVIAAPLPVVDGAISALLIDAQHIYMGGEFGHVDSTPIQNLARLSLDGATPDWDWTPDPDGAVRVLADLADARILVAGDFASIGGIEQASIARVSASGAGVVDVDWRPVVSGAVPAARGWLEWASPWMEGTAAIGGWFQHIGEHERIGFALVGDDGSAIDERLDVESAGLVYATSVQADGAMVLGGRFYKVDGERRGNLARLLPNGSLDPVWKPEVDGAVYGLAARNDGFIYVAGSFDGIGGHALYNLARVSDSDAGAPDTSWFLDNAGWDIRNLAFAPDGALIASGAVVIVGSFGHEYLAKISTDVPATFDPNWTPFPDYFVLTATVGDDDWLYLGGDFLNLGDAYRPHLARVQLDGNGAVDESWPAESPDGPVRTLARDGSGSIYLGGDFHSIGPIAQSFMAKLDAAGQVYATWQPPINEKVFQIVLSGDGLPYYISREFWDTHGEVRRVAGATDGALDPHWRLDANGEITELSAHDPASLLVAGAFSRINDRARGGLAQISLVASRIFQDGFELAD